MNQEERMKRVNDFMWDDFPDNIAPRPIEKRLWPHMVALTDGADVHRMFGFSNGMFSTYDQKWCFFYSPEVVVESTAALSNAQFEDWLRYMRAHINAHASLQTQDETMVDDRVFSVMPEARDLIALVHNSLFEF